MTVDCPMVSDDDDGRRFISHRYTDERLDDTEHPALRRNNRFWTSMELLHSGPSGLRALH